MGDTMASDNTQFELFPFLQGRYTHVARPRYLLKDLTLSVENTIVLGIIFIMAVVLFFSFGVERGKRIVRKALSETSGQANAAALIIPPAAAASADAQADIKAQKANAPDTRGVVADKSVEVPSRKMDVYPSPEKKKEGGVFTIQVASFKERQNAQKEAKRLEAKGYKIFVLPKGNHSIVCVGKFALKDEAAEFSNKLKKSYNDCVVRRL